MLKYHSSVDLMMHDDELSFVALKTLCENITL